MGMDSSLLLPPSSEDRATDPGAIKADRVMASLVLRVKLLLRRLPPRRGGGGTTGEVM